MIIKYLFMAIPFLFTSSLIATPVDLRLLHLFRAVFIATPVKWRLHLLRAEVSWSGLEPKHSSLEDVVGSGVASGARGGNCSGVHSGVGGHGEHVGRAGEAAVGEATLCVQLTGLEV